MVDTRVAVITPYHGESLAWLEQCHQSVREQTYPCLHVLVADGLPEPTIDTWAADHVVLPRGHADIGSTPRLVGCIHAIGLRVDAVAFLDADNWFYPEHVSRLMAAQERTGAAFLSSSRMLHRLDGTPMAPCPLTDPERFIDTNCMLFTRDAFSLLHHWVLMPPYAHLIGDRVMLHHVCQSGLQRHHCPEPSVAYRCGKAGLYVQLGEIPPAGVEPRPDYKAAFEQWRADGHPPLAG